MNKRRYYISNARFSKNSSTVCVYDCRSTTNYGIESKKATEVEQASYLTYSLSVWVAFSSVPQAGHAVSPISESNV